MTDKRNGEVGMRNAETKDGARGIGCKDKG